MADIEIAIEKLIKMQEYVKQLANIKPLTYEVFKDDLTTKYAIERLVQLIVDLAIDVNNVLLAYYNKPPANDYFNSFIEIAESGILPQSFALQLAPSAGLRNRLVHEYEKINDEIVFNSLQQVVEMYSKYIKEVNRFIQAQSN